MSSTIENGAISGAIVANNGAIPDDTKEAIKEADKAIEEKLKTSFRKRITLKDVRVAWVDGELRCNGLVRKVESVAKSLQAKHLRWGATKPLTKDELENIIYKDPSMYRQKASPVDELKLRMKRLEIEERRMEVAKLRTQYQAVNYAKHQAQKDAVNLTRRLSKDSLPSEFGVEMFQRLNPQYVIMAIRSKHPELSNEQCKMIIGSWIGRGL